MQMEFCEKKFIAALGRTSCDLGLMLQATCLLFSVTQTHRASPKSWPWAPNSSPERGLPHRDCPLDVHLTEAFPDSPLQPLPRSSSPGLLKSRQCFQSLLSKPGED